MWNYEENYFYSTELAKLIKAKSLHLFTPESIRDWWGNPQYLSERSSMAFLAKIGIASIIAIPICLIVAILYNWLLGISGICVAIIAFITVSRKQKGILIKRDKRAGRWVDTKKIRWCKNCVHFRNIRDWEDSFDGLWKSSELPDNFKLPCNINNETINLWRSFFDLPEDNRYLYPKDCNRFEFKS